MDHVGTVRRQGRPRNAFGVTDEHRYTHVRLSIYPDGGVARLRVHGEAVPDPRFLAGTLDLAAAENGGLITGCSDMFYSSAANLIAPGRARTMGEGWENARRRDDGHDWVRVPPRAGGPRPLRRTGHVLFRRQRARLGKPVRQRRRSGPGSVPGPGADSGAGEWPELLPRTRLQPDTRHHFRVAPGPPVAAARLDVYPDGGLARVRLWGEADPAAHRAAAPTGWTRCPQPRPRTSSPPPACRPPAPATSPPFRAVGPAAGGGPYRP